MKIIQKYATIVNSTDKEREQLHEDSSNIVLQKMKLETSIILGDLNAKIKEKEEDNTACIFGLGTRNDRGDSLMQFC